MRVLLASAVLLLVVGLTGQTVQADTKEQATVDVEALVASMSTERKVAQLMILGFPGTTVRPAITKWITERGLGGVAIFSRNIVDLPQTLALTRKLHSLTSKGIPLFISLDQEGGNVVRVKDGATVLPGNMALGAARSTRLAYVAGQAVAIDLRRLGFNMNLAPVLDMNSNPQNPVIGTRSFGEQPQLVGELGSWFVRGQQEMGVVSVAKHFPGHGDTKQDSHFALPVVDASLSDLEARELLPFEDAMDAGLDAVMTGHIALPNVTGNNKLPATLSKTLLTGTLRAKLGFTGITITDDLEMRGMIDVYGAGEAAVMSVLAGADMIMVLWTARKQREVYRALLAAVRSGRISEQRLDASIRRILKIKARRGLFTRQLEPVRRIMKDQNPNRLHLDVASRVASQAVTLVRNHGQMLPLHPNRYRKIVVLAPAGEFGRYLTEHYKTVRVVRVPRAPSRAQRLAVTQQLVNEGADADALVVAVFNRYHVKIAKAASKALSHLPLALVSLASPYYLTSVPDTDAYVCTYSSVASAQQSAARALMGETSMTGRLPVSIPGYYPYGHRIEPTVTDFLPTRPLMLEN